MKDRQTDTHTHTDRHRDVREREREKEREMSKASDFPGNNTAGDDSNLEWVNNTP